MSDPTTEYLALAACMLVPGIIILVILVWNRRRRSRWDYGRRYDKD